MTAACWLAKHPGRLCRLRAPRRLTLLARAFLQPSLLVLLSIQTFSLSQTLCHKGNKCLSGVLSCEEKTGKSAPVGVGLMRR